MRRRDGFDHIGGRLGKGKKKRLKLEICKKRGGNRLLGGSFRSSFVGLLRCVFGNLLFGGNQRGKKKKKEKKKKRGEEEVVVERFA